MDAPRKPYNAHLLPSKRKLISQTYEIYRAIELKDFLKRYRREKYTTGKDLFENYKLAFTAGMAVAVART